MALNDNPLVKVGIDIKTVNTENQSIEGVVSLFDQGAASGLVYSFYYETGRSRLELMSGNCTLKVPYETVSSRALEHIKSMHAAIFHEQAIVWVGA